MSSLKDSSRKRGLIPLTILILVIIGISLFFSRDKRNLDFKKSPKTVSISDSEIQYEVSTNSDQVASLLSEKGIVLGEYDVVMPDKDSAILPGVQVEIKRSYAITIKADGKEIAGRTLAKTIREAIRENGLTLGRLDKVSPDPEAPVGEDEKIAITRINIEEKTLQEDIDFKTITKNDSKMGWREKKVEQKGEKGILEVNYKITYKDGKEISRVALSKNVIKDPIPETIIQGTYVKFGKTHSGLGTWYAWKGGLYAASPWLPMGSYAKVTNRANGKSVIVEINDRGPFGENRIIDLDKVAFGKIASIGAGVIDVKVEEVLN